MRANDRAGRARVVEVDVREEEVADVAELELALGEPARRAGRQLVGPQSKSARPSSVSTTYEPMQRGTPW